MSLMRLGAILVVAVLVPACDPFPGFFVPFPPTAAKAELRGSQVVPAVATVATGSATLIVSGLQDRIDYAVSHSGLGTVTSVTVHAGAPGVNGPVMFTLVSGSGQLTAIHLDPAF